MHRCLCVDEIVRLVAQELVDADEWATAAALACSCKSFENPVLDTLWTIQCDFIPLLKTLPEDVWDPNHKVSIAKMIFPPAQFAQPFGLKISEQFPDDPGMETFLEVRSEDAKSL